MNDEVIRVYLIIRTVPRDRDILTEVDYKNDQPLDRRCILH